MIKLASYSCIKRITRNHNVLQVHMKRLLTLSNKVVLGVWLMQFSDNDLWVVTPSKQVNASIILEARLEIEQETGHAGTMYSDFGIEA